jgi:hypothetical protein
MKKLISLFFMVLFLFYLQSCHRSDEDNDVLSQEEISAIILLVKDNATGMVKTYQYAANAIQNPKIILENGKIYTVDVIFKNGQENLNSEILAAKDEHFILFQIVNASITINRLDGAGDLRSDGNRVGFRTQWIVNNLSTSNAAQFTFVLNHAAISVSEAQNNNTFGTVIGGEVDAQAIFDLSH